MVFITCSRGEIANEHDMLLSQDRIAHLLRQVVHAIVHHTRGGEVRPPGDTGRFHSRRLNIGTAYDFHAAGGCGLCVATCCECRDVPGRVDRSDLVGVGSGRREPIIRIIPAQRQVDFSHERSITKYLITRYIGGCGGCPHEVDSRRREYFRGDAAAGGSRGRCGI